MEPETVPPELPVIPGEEWREVQSTIERANALCTDGMDLLSPPQTLDNFGDCVDSGILVKKIDAFLDIVQNISDELARSTSFLSSATTSQSRILLKQVHKRVDDLQTLLAKKRSAMAQHINKAKLRRTSGSSSSTTVPPPQPLTLLTEGRNLTNLHSELKAAKPTSQLEETGKCELPAEKLPLQPASSTSSLDSGSLHSSPLLIGNGKCTDENLEIQRIKRGHVLKELLDTESTYVNEIGDILNGYQEVARNMQMKSLLPKQLQQPITVQDSTDVTTENHLPSNLNILFGNLDEIHHFHAKSFLPDLSNCIGNGLDYTLELVGLCFIQRHLDFLNLYSRYCQLLPASETLRNEIGENHPWFVHCRQRLNHKLPLGAYLLKPVQRITKYQLLLKDLLKNSEGYEGYPVLLDALDHLLVVLRCVDDGMLQLSIVGYPNRLQDEGQLLLQGSFMLWTETKKDRLRLKGHQRHLFLYEKSILICKKYKDPKATSLYFKSKINLCEIGLTEVLRGSGSQKKFEIWVEGRLKVFILQAETVESKEMWVQAIKKLLLEQLESLRVTKRFSGIGISTAGLTASTKRHKMMAQNKGVSMNGWKVVSSNSHRPLRQTSSWVESDSRPRSSTSGDGEGDDDCSSDMSNSDDEEPYTLATNQDSSSVQPMSQPLYSMNYQNNCVNGSVESIENGPKYVALADYNAIGTSEISFKEGDILLVRKTGCAGWWFVSSTGEPCEKPSEGWAPSAFLEKLQISSSTTT